MFTQIMHSTLVLLFAVVTTAAQAQSYTIRKSVPFQRGDRWRTEITSTKVSSGKVMTPGNDQQVNEKETTHLSAVVTIDQVDQDGYATVWLAKIIRFVGPAPGSDSKVLLRPGTVVLFDRIIEPLSVTLENGAPLDEWSGRIGELLALTDLASDAPFVPAAPMKPGETWKANIESMRETILEKGPPQLRDYPDILALEASGKVVGIKQHRDKECLELTLTTRTAISEEIENPGQIIKKADQEVQELILIPADFATGLLDKRTVTRETFVTQSKVAGPSLDVTQTTTATEKRTYLEFKGGGIRPWKAPATADTLMEQLLFGLDFDQTSSSGSGKDARVASHGWISESLPVQSSGHVGGKAGQAMLFDGKDDHVSVEGAVDYLREAVESVTVACWVKTPPKKLQFFFDVGFYGDSSLTLLAQEKTAKFHLSPKAGGVGLQFPLDAADWTHVAVTWDGALQRAFVNGKLVAESSTARKGLLDHASIGINPLVVGTQSKPPSRQQRYFAGAMDEMAVWTRALDPAEIATVFGIGQQGQSLFDR